MKILLILVILTSCYFIQRTDVKIINNSTIAFDSSIVGINYFRIKCDYLKGGDSAETCFLKKNVSASHDVVYSLKLYNHDSLIIKKFFFSNDLGVVSDMITFKIFKDLTVEFYEK